MEKIQDHINRIHSKLQQLLKQQSALEKQNVVLIKEKNELKQQIESCDIQNKKLQEQNYILKAATNNMSEPDKAVFEQSISKYVRDIDKCIALLGE